jgi:hypothetical protein
MSVTNRQPIFINKPLVYCTIVSQSPDSNRNNPTNITDLMSASAHGGQLVKRITITALAQTAAGLVRLWVSDGNAAYYLWKEIPMTAVTPNDTTAAWAYTLDLTNDLQIGDSTVSGSNYGRAIAMTYTGSTTVDFSVIVEAGEY